MGYNEDLAKRAYMIINDTANSNSVVQGLSGMVGFPFTLIADGVTIFTHYGEMLNKIRSLYNRTPVSEQIVGPILTGMSSEVLFDVVADKVLGNVPLLGIYFNAICAKTMTWRIGIVFTMLAARGDSVSSANINDVTKLVRQMFPQNDTFKFKQPTYATFEKMVVSVSGNSEAEFNKKISTALNAFD